MQIHPNHVPHLKSRFSTFGFSVLKDNLDQNTTKLNHSNLQYPQFIVMKIRQPFIALP